MSSSILPPTCYYPNATIALNSLPCDITANISSCCPESYSCNSQFECLNSADPDTTDTSVVIGPSCTLESFDSDYCGCPVFGAQTACSDGTICCGLNNSTCCDNSLGRYSVIYDYDAPLPTGSAAVQSYLTNTAVPAAQTLEYTYSAAPTVVTTTGSGVGVPSATTTSSAGVGDTAGHGMSLSTKIAIAVGAVLGCFLVGLFALCLVLVVRRRKRRQARQKVVEEGHGVAGVVGNTGRPSRSEYEMFGDVKHQVEIDSMHIMGAELDDKAVKVELDGLGKNRRSKISELDGVKRREVNELGPSALRYELE